MSTLSHGDPPVALAMVGEEAVVTLSRPANRNALTPELLERLIAQIERAEESGARVITLAAAGPAFCSGLNLRETDVGRLRDGIRLLLVAMRRILTSPVPMIARIHGPVRAGGIGLVTAADMAIAAEHVTFAFTEARLALAPAVVSVTVLPRLRSRDASRLFLTAEQVSAARAAELGLIDAAVRVEDLDAHVAHETSRLLLGHPQGLRATKALLTREMVADLDDRGDALIELSLDLFTSTAAREAIAANQRR